MENTTAEQNNTIVPTYTKKIGKTTNIVGVHFDENAKDELEKKLLRVLEDKLSEE